MSLPAWLYDWYARVDDWGRRLTHVPWLSVVGLALHQLAGQLLRIPLHLAHSPWWLFPVMGIVAGLVHEFTQALDAGGQFDRPWLNVTLDVLAFVPLAPWG